LFPREQPAAMTTVEAPRHLADMKFTLSPEHWSPTSVVEDKIHTKIVGEDEKRRKAVQARKEAETALRKAKQLKDDKERRWATRMEEKARYTEQQRAWWDNELAHMKAETGMDTSSRGAQTNHTGAQEAAEKSKVIDREQHAIAMREKHVRENHEDEVAGWDAEWKANRVADDRAMREAVRQKHDVAEAVFDDFKRQAKAELAHETITLHNAEVQSETSKFQNGEAERREREQTRQMREDTNAKSQVVDYSHKTEMFLRDEAARAGFSDAKAAKAKARLEHGKNRQAETEKDRIASERAAKRKQNADKKAFHEAQRLKAAETALMKEKVKRVTAEKTAAETMIEVERASAEAKVTMERARQAAGELSAIKAPLGGGRTGARTAHEARMRAVYGTGEGVLYGKGDGVGIEPSHLDFWEP